MRIATRPDRRLLTQLIVSALVAGCGGKDASAPVRSLASLTGISGDQLAGTAGVALAGCPTVEARDEDGAPMAGVSVRFTITSGGGALSDTNVMTGADGRASTAWLLGPDAAATQS